MRLTRRQKRRVKEMAGEIGAGLLVSGMMVALVLAWLSSEPEGAEASEHYNQIYCAGVWWDKDDYDAMCEERDAYLEAEAAAEEALYSASTAEPDEAKDETGSEDEPTASAVGNLDFDADESYMLAKIAMAEAEGEDTEGKALVILTVLNRVQSENFPDGIEGVIKQKNQFAAYENGRYDELEPSEDCWAALELVQSGWDESKGATYFERKTSAETWHSTTLTELFTHGNHTFYKEAEE